MLSLSAQIARDPDRASTHIAASRRRLFVIFVADGAGRDPAGRLGLQIFGAGYAEAANVLRLLLIGMIPRLVITHELGVRQALNNGMGFARLQLVSTLVVIAVALFVPITAADPSGVYQVGELWPLAVAYTVSQALCAVFVLFTSRGAASRSCSPRPSRQRWPRGRSEHARGPACERSDPRRAAR